MKLKNCYNIFLFLTLSIHNNHPQEFHKDFDTIKSEDFNYFVPSIQKKNLHIKHTVPVYIVSAQSDKKKNKKKH